MRQYRGFLAALVVAGLSSMALGADETYPIQLHRVSKVGDVYDTHVTSEQTQNATINLPQLGPQTQNQSIKADLQGRVEVLEVNGNGDSTSLALTVQKFTDDAGKALVEAGKVIEIKRDASQATFSLRGGGDVTEEVKRLLTMTYHPVKDTNEDDTYGSKTPRKVGESWPINAEFAAKDATREGVTIDPKNISGNTTLQGVETVNGTKALRMTSNMDVKNLKLPVPPGATIDNCLMKCQFGGLFPVDPALRSQEEEMTMDMEVAMSGNGAKIETKVHMAQKEVTTPVKK